MNVLKGMAAKALEAPKPVKVKIDTRGMFNDPKERSYRDLDEEKAYRISPKMVYKPMECIKKITW